MIAWREQNLLQSDRPATDFGFKASWQEQWAAAAHWVAEDPPGRWLFVLDKALSPCVEAAQVVDIGTSNRNRWLLVPGTALDPDCRTPSFDGETIERLIGIERGNNPVAVRPHHPRAIDGVAVRVGVTRLIEERVPRRLEPWRVGWRLPVRASREAREDDCRRCCKGLRVHWQFCASTLGVTVAGVTSHVP